MTIDEISHTTKHQKIKLQSFFFHHFLTAEIENAEPNVMPCRIFTAKISSRRKYLVYGVTLYTSAIF